MSKYIEELSYGDAFISDSLYYVLTSDFKKNGDRLAICLSDGSARWFNSSLITKPTQLYITDKDSNIIPIKPTEKKHANTEN
jgi:hypothetical protein